MKKTLVVENYLSDVGRLYPVYNHDKKLVPKARVVYNLVTVYDPSFGKEKCLLFTDNELKNFRVQFNCENFEEGILHKVIESKISYYFLKISAKEGKFIIKLTPLSLKKSEYRSFENNDSDKRYYQGWSGI